MLRCCLILLCVVSLLSAGAGVASAAYPFYGLPDIFGGSDNEANGINNAGQVVGVGVHTSGQPMRVSLGRCCRTDRPGKPGPRLCIHRVCHQ